MTKLKTNEDVVDQTNDLKFKVFKAERFTLKYKIINYSKICFKVSKIKKWLKAILFKEKNKWSYFYNVSSII